MGHTLMRSRLAQQARESTTGDVNNLWLTDPLDEETNRNVLYVKLWEIPWDRIPVTRQFAFQEHIRAKANVFYIIEGRTGHIADTNAYYDNVATPPTHPHACRVTL